jgi:hypothetical protein
VEFTDVILQSAGTVAKGARSQKRNHRRITGILICKYHRELVPHSVRQEVEDPLIPRNKGAVATLAEVVLCSQVIIVLDVED